MDGSPPQQERAGLYFCRQAARCVAAVPGGTDGKHPFLVGTCTLQQPNELHLVEFCEEKSEVVCRHTLPHPEEVWFLSVSASDPSQVLTYSAGNCTPALRLWRIDSAEDAEASLIELCGVAAGDVQLASVKVALWDVREQGRLVVADAESLHVLDAGAGGVAQLQPTLAIAVGQRCSGACLDPHHASQACTVDETSLKGWDLRSGKMTHKKDVCAHPFSARDVDYNPNVPHQVLTTGEDAVLRFWDLRKLDSSLKTLSGGHHFWTMRARYNAHHDQLVLSCGADSAVCLWRAPSVASKPLSSAPQHGGTAQQNGHHPGQGARPADGLVRRYEEHEDSCYNCCWSMTDPWVFASVAYDGRLVVNRVPAEERMGILLPG